MKEQILKLRSEGKTYSEIKSILGCSKGTISFHCGIGQKGKHNIANQKRRKKNKEWIENIKKDLSCKTCGENRWWLLDFHHEDPSKKEASVSRMIKAAKKERVLEEIKKCSVLCSNCHRDLHYKMLV